MLYSSILSLFVTLHVQVVMGSRVSKSVGFNFTQASKSGANLCHTPFPQHILPYINHLPTLSKGSAKSLLTIKPLECPTRMSGSIWDLPTSKQTV
jgi:hypothetical protein